jgi:hypothetical protein
MFAFVMVAAYSVEGVATIHHHFTAGNRFLIHDRENMEQIKEKAEVSQDPKVQSAYYNTIAAALSFAARMHCIQEFGTRDMVLADVRTLRETFCTKGEAIDEVMAVLDTEIFKKVV